MLTRWYHNASYHARPSSTYSNPCAKHIPNADAQTVKEISINILIDVVVKRISVDRSTIVGKLLHALENVTDQLKG
jgi:hypothetical protein